MGKMNIGRGGLEESLNSTTLWKQVLQVSTCWFLHEVSYCSEVHGSELPEKDVRTLVISLKLLPQKPEYLPETNGSSLKIGKRGGNLPWVTKNRLLFGPDGRKKKQRKRQREKSGKETRQILKHIAGWEMILSFWKGRTIMIRWKLAPIPGPHFPLPMGGRVTLTSHYLLNIFRCNVFFERNGNFSRQCYLVNYAIFRATRVLQLAFFGSDVSSGNVMLEVRMSRVFFLTVSN